MLPYHPLRSLLCGLLALLFALPGALLAAEMTQAEAQVVAERICTFPHFVDWPAKKIGAADTPFVIGVFGADAISGLLRETIQDRRIKDHPVVVKRLLATEELPGCHMVFVSRSENAQLGRVLGVIKRAGVLSIGESDNFISRGGVINLLAVDGTIRFQINLDAARRERLNISSKLLQLSIPQSRDGSIFTASASGPFHP